MAYDLILLTGINTMRIPVSMMKFNLSLKQDLRMMRMLTVVTNIDLGRRQCQMSGDQFEILQEQQQEVATYGPCYRKVLGVLDVCSLNP